MWNMDVQKKAIELEDQMEDIEEEQNAPHFKTVDHEELYDGLTVQLNQRHHTDEFNERVEAYEQAMEDEQKQDQAVVDKMQQEAEAHRLMAQGQVP